MKETIRTFIAIKVNPGEKLNDLITDCKKSLKDEEIRWVASDSLHLTLQFLGETRREQIAEIIDLLASVSKLINPFKFELKGLSVFKKKAQYRVLFLSVENDTILKQLASEIFKKLKLIGFHDEGNSYYPHLTLSRMKYIKDKDNFNSLLRKFSDMKIQQVTVSEIILYQSILRTEGPTYNPIKIVNLI